MILTYDNKNAVFTLGVYAYFSRQYQYLYQTQGPFSGNKHSYYVAYVTVLLSNAFFVIQYYCIVIFYSHWGYPVDNSDIILLQIDLKSFILVGKKVYVTCVTFGSFSRENTTHKVNERRSLQIKHFISNVHLEVYHWQLALLVIYKVDFPYIKFSLEYMITSNNSNKLKQAEMVYTLASETLKREFRINLQTE